MTAVREVLLPMTPAFLGLLPGEAWKVTVVVSGQDLQEGVPGDCWDCPVVRALSRLLPGLVICVVDRGITVYADAGGGDLGEVIAHAPAGDDLRRFIGQVDTENAPGPRPFLLTFTRT